MFFLFRPTICLLQNGQCVDSTTKDVRLMKHRAHVLHQQLKGFVQRWAYADADHYADADYYADADHYADDEASGARPPPAA